MAKTEAGKEAGGRLKCCTLSISTTANDVMLCAWAVYSCLSGHAGKVATGYSFGNP
jgi:hypothetical protein